MIHGILATITFSLVGMAVMFVAYRIIDKSTPGDLAKELLENKNTALAMVVSAMILGISIIIAAAIAG